MSSEGAEQVSEILDTVRQVLGEAPSEIFLQRVEKTLTSAGSNPQERSAACRRVVNLVKLFIDEKKAVALEQRLRLFCELGV